MSYCPTYWQSLGCLESFISFNYIKKALVPNPSWMTTTRTWKVMEGGGRHHQFQIHLVFFVRIHSTVMNPKKSTKSPPPKRQLKIPEVCVVFFNFFLGSLAYFGFQGPADSRCPRCFSIPMGRWRKPAKSEKSVEPPERRPSHRSLESMFPLDPLGPWG